MAQFEFPSDLFDNYLECGEDSSAAQRLPLRTTENPYLVQLIGDVLWVSAFGQKATFRTATFARLSAHRESREKNVFGLDVQAALLDHLHQ